MPKFRVILATLALLAASIPVIAGPAAAACSGYAYLWDGLNATGTYKAICMDDSVWSLDGNYRFNDGTVMDNRISSVSYSSGAPVNGWVTFWTGYYGQGTCCQTVYNNAGADIDNLNTTYSNHSSTVVANH